ncbi:MAG: ABC transporter permease [Cyclobacteriaceae bacterium]
MIKNYLITALRTLLKYKGYSALNIVGLAIGIASFLLISLYVYHELSYDRYHENADNIYRIVENLRTENEILFQSTSSPPMGPTFAREFPEVKGFVRFNEFWQTLVQKDDTKFYEEKCFLADSSVFNIFSFPMLEGDPQTALTEPHTVVLTETTAQKYFDDQDPMGKSLLIRGENYTVTGVMKDVPENSHFTVNMLLSFITFSSENRRAEEEAWFWNGFHTYLLLEPGENQAENLQAKIPDFINKYMPNDDKSGMYYEDLPLQPLTSIYLEVPRSWENGERGSKSNILILSIIALFILAIACFNYVNLATARSSRRMKEVGLRKVLGAERAALIRQFLGESILVSFISMLLGLLIAVLTLPLFNNMLETSLGYGLLSNVYVWAGLLGLTLLLGVLAGGYPAFLVSGFHPLSIFKNAPRSMYGNNWLRKMLVSGQFVISITLIAGTLLVFDQLNLIQHMNLGFDKEETLTLWYNGNQEIREHLDAIKNEMQEVPGVQSVAASSSVPGGGINNLFSLIEIADGSMSPTNINTYRVDYDFIPNYGINVLAGRNFSRDFPADDTTAFIINEAAVKNLGFTSPEAAVGRKVDQQGKKGTIVGVVQDFNYKSLHYAVEPLIIHMNSNWYNVLSIKIQSDDIPEVVSQLDDKWMTLASGLPFNYSFLDQDYDKLYNAETQLSKVVTIFSSLAIFVACLGLLGLTSFSVQRRFKEIGIRKVLGASVRSVVVLIANEFIRLIIIALFIAIPITYYVINLWLENFTNRISINPLTFALAGLGTLIIAWLTVSYLSIKAAQSNPVDSLKNE